MANHGDILSTCSCHFGGFFGFLGCCLISRRCRIAITTRTPPRAAFTASAAIDGAVCGLGGVLPVATTETVTTIARDISQPNTNAAPFSAPRCEGSTIRNAVRGRGSRATAKPIRTRLRSMPVLLSRPDEGSPGATRRVGLADESALYARHAGSPSLTAPWYIHAPKMIGLRAAVITPSGGYGPPSMENPAYRSETTVISETGQPSDHCPSPASASPPAAGVGGPSAPSAWCP